MTNVGSRVPDAFISHSSRDKQDFVRPLVECLADQGAHVWYDEYSLVAGDSLSAAIDRGLAAARCGVVVISPAFIETAQASGWTHYELRGIVSNSIGAKGKRLLPIWLDVTPDDVRAWSPPLADLLAIPASGKSIEHVALDVMRVIAPDRGGGLARLRALFDIRRGGNMKETGLGDVDPAPTQDRRVPGNVPLRALLVAQTLADSGVPHAADLETFLENLSRDLHHEGELRVWEAIAGAYSLVKESRDLDATRRRALCHFLLAASLGQTDVAAVEVLTSRVADLALERFQALWQMSRGEVMIGEGGLRGVIFTDDNAASSHPEQADAT